MDPSTPRLLERRKPRHRAVVIRLHFPSEGVLVNEHVASPKLTIRVSSETPIEQLPGRFLDFVKQKIDPRGILIRQLQKKKQALSLTCSIWMSDSPQRKFLIGSKCRMALVRDLFQGSSSSPGESLNADLVFRMIEVPTVGSACRVDDMILLSKAQKEHRTCLRIGYYPIQDVEIADSSLQDKRTAGRADAVAYCWALVVFYDDALRNVAFRRVHCYEFDDFCIGDINESGAWHRLRYDNTYYYLGSFRNVLLKGETRKQFMRRLRAHIKDGLGSLGTGLPLMPTLCFNPFNAEKLGLGLQKWPKQGVNIALTFVNRCLTDRALRSIVFPRDVRLIFNKRDVLRDRVLFEMEVVENQDGEKVNSARLFEPRHHEKWDLEVWVLPQPGRRKMYQLYRYEGGELIQFLDPSENVRTRDKSLYLEVHVVLKQ